MSNRRTAADGGLHQIHANGLSAGQVVKVETTAGTIVLYPRGDCLCVVPASVPKKLRRIAHDTCSSVTRGTKLRVTDKKRDRNTVVGIINRITVEAAPASRPARRS